MHPLEKKTLKIVQQEHLLQTGEKIVVGVSAGPDSMALLHVLARLVPALDITLAAVYVNHGLRPDEAAKEKIVVEAAANNLDVVFFSGSVDVKEFADSQKFSIEHAARLLRYDFFEKTAREFGAHKIAVAHTADEQAEEILLRLIRGTARKGLSGMKTIRADKIIRPFLKVPKADVLEYLDKYSIPFQLDSSNMQHNYLRNRIRNELLPYLTERYNPDVRQTLLRTANILQDEEELLEKITAAAFAKTVSSIPQSPAQVKNGSTISNKSYPQELVLSLEFFNCQPRAIQRRLMEKCCWRMACEPSSRQIENLLHLANPGSPSGSLHLSDGLRVTKYREQLNFKYPMGRVPLRGNISHETGTTFPETRIPGPGSYDFPVLNKRLVVGDSKECIYGSEDIFHTGEYLDSGLFSFPLTLRGPRPGERFRPLGAPGSKKITDYLSDKKIEKHIRPQIPVLCADDSVLALPGLGIDHRYSITERTTHAIRVNWEDID